jgi:hypothetical protein
MIRYVFIKYFGQYLQFNLFLSQNLSALGDVKLILKM